MLFDSRCGATLINNQFLSKLKKKKSGTSKWTSKAGEFVTTKTCIVQFSLPEFHQHREIEWNVYVDDSKSKHCSYDMIIGQDILH